MTSAIVLAAGSSRRMGAANKLTLPYAGHTILEAIIIQLQASLIDEIIVVLGHEKEVIKTLLSPYKGLVFCYNAEHLTGMTSSIQMGVKSASEHTDGYLICLSDMPFLETNDYNTILHHINHQKEILLPFYEHKKGNPVYFSKHFRNDILNHKELEGCRGIVQKNKAFIQKIVFDNDHILRDIDTVGAYEKSQVSKGEKK